MKPSNIYDLICCPVCHGDFSAIPTVGSDIEEELHCDNCSARYPVRAGIPDLMPTHLIDNSSWNTWQQHLEAFQARREQRLTNPKKIANRLTHSGEPQQRAFVPFTGIKDGVVLDIGCGPGKFRHQLPDAVNYVGMDPIPLPEATEFQFVRGVGENIPFPDSGVRHITVLSALDHFNDLDAFLIEATRVLEPVGRLHIIQQIHEHGLSIRGFAHWAKDALEDRATKHDDDVPHHMTEFDKSILHDALTKHFTVEREEIYSMNMYSPRRLFLSLAPKTH